MLGFTPAQPRILKALYMPYFRAYTDYVSFEFVLSILINSRSAGGV